MSTRLHGSIPRKATVIVFITVDSCKSYLLTPRSKVLLQKLSGSQSRNYSYFMESEGSLPHLQVPATCPYPEPDQSSPCPHPTSWRSILILSSHLCLGLPSGLFPSGFPTKTLYISLLYSIHATCPTHLILLDLITWIIFGEEYRCLSFW